MKATSYVGMIINSLLLYEMHKYIILVFVFVHITCVQIIETNNSQA